MFPFVLQIHVVGQFCKNTRARTPRAALSELEGVTTQFDHPPAVQKASPIRVDSVMPTWSKLRHEVLSFFGEEDATETPDWNETSDSSESAAANKRILSVAIGNCSKTNFHWNEVSEASSTNYKTNDCPDYHEPLCQLEPVRRKAAHGGVKNERNLLGTVPVSSVGQYVDDLEPVSMCQKEMRDSEFLVLWKALETATTSRTVFAWEVDQSRVQIKYSLKADAVLISIVTWHDRTFFLAAAILNLLGAIGVGLYVVRQLFDIVETVIFLEMEQDEPVIRQMSHRLVHEVTKPKSNPWYIHVQSVFRPNSGFKIRWTHRAVFHRIAIMIERVDCDWPVTEAQPLLIEEVEMETETSIDATGDSGLLNEPPHYLSSISSLQTSVLPPSSAQTRLLSESHSTPASDRSNCSDETNAAPMKSRIQDVKTRKHECTFVYLPAIAVKIVDTMSGYQREIEIPLQSPPPRCHEHYVLDSRQRWKLDSKAKYRIKLMGLSDTGIVQEESSWSSEVTCAHDVLWNETAMFLMRRATRSAFSSWYFFVSKCLRPIVTDTLLVRFNSFGIEIRGNAPTNKWRINVPQNHTLKKNCHFVVSMGWGRRTHAVRVRIFVSFFSSRFFLISIFQFSFLITKSSTKFFYL
eukprot:Gregarina_sp_Poly_1__2448@NODE_165_length_12211_cov_32_860425_g147_i0_p2_GENE_NODE_165_length_12211_cov_32_860425_g147_i0NODE_165_length_12211_cov_32_860425_g147_i0_p2_ORF_typecomplete_len634_score66_50_NODE_165_length_12211_cov_32_860425_g147_i023234224